MLMFRSGLVLLLVSTVGVTLRSLEWAYLMGPMAKIVCSFALTISVICFLGTYCSWEFTPHRARLRK